MKYGALNVILKANKKVCNGESWYPHGPRKFTWWYHKWRKWSSLSSVSRVLFTLKQLH